MKVRVHGYHAVAYWVWNVKDPDDVCGICQNHFDGTCSTCRIAGDGCPLLFGECSHVFHMHCIERWLANAPKRDDGTQHEVCPMCKRPWMQAALETDRAGGGAEAEAEAEVEVEAEAASATTETSHVRRL